MGKINSVKKLTDNKFVNLYGVDATPVYMIRRFLILWPPGRSVWRI